MADERDGAEEVVSVMEMSTSARAQYRPGSSMAGMEDPMIATNQRHGHSGGNGLSVLP